MSVLSLSNVSYRYRGSREQTLQRITIAFERGKFYAIVGQSGAGKSTLLSLLAGLDVPDEGAIMVDGVDIATTGYHTHRRKHISLIFQNYNLIDYLTPLENVRLVDKRAPESLLTELGLEPEQLHRNVLKLSGGQQQRVAIARALASQAPIVLADEPTGNLDEQTAAAIVQILSRAAHERNKCVIVVTHSASLARCADVVLEMKHKHMKRNGAQ